MSIDYAEQLFQSMDTIITKRINELSFDKTIICTITDDTEKEVGKYIVTDGSMTFEAYGDNKDYEKDNQVLVTIPNGDWSQQKTILNKYITSEDVITYHSPTHGIGNLTGNLVKHNIDVVGLAASGMDKYESEDGTEFNVPMIVEIGKITGKSYNTNMFTNLCVKAKFQTTLGNYRFTSGSYGIKIVLNQKETSEEETLSGNFNIICDFSSSKDMFGSVYDFVDWTHQEQSFQIPKNVETIENIQIYFYQNRDFKYLDEEGHEESLCPIHTGEKNFFHNIYAKDIEVYLGYDSDKTGATIYTDQSLEYKPGNVNRTVSLVWTEKDDKGNAISIFEEESSEKTGVKLKDGYRIQWFMDTTKDSLQHISKQEYDDHDSINFNCQSSLSTIKVQAKVLKGLENTEDFVVYESNVLEFENYVDKMGLVPLSSIVLRFVNKDNALDSYPYYNLYDNKIVNEEDANIERTIGVQWRAIKNNIDQSFWNGAKFEWEYPINNTLITTVGYTEGYEPVEEGTSPEFDKNSLWNDVPNCTFTYKISNEYFESNKNNTITCKIILDDKIAYEGQKELQVEKKLNFSTLPTQIKNGEKKEAAFNIMIEDEVFEPIRAEINDAIEKIESKIDPQQYLTQENVFNALTENGSKQGIFMDETTNNIYVNSSYIATGILRSSNWKGVLTGPSGTKYSDNAAAEQAIAEGREPCDGNWTLEATSGTYWDLNNGQLFSSVFELNAWNNDSMKGIYMNSNPSEDQSYLRIGAGELDDNGNWHGDNLIELSGDRLLLSSTSFVLNAWNNDAGGIYFNSEPLSSDDYYFRLGKKENFIEMDETGNFTIQTNGVFILNAWNDSTGGFYINSDIEGKTLNVNGQEDTYYFLVGNDDNYLAYNGSLLEIKGQLHISSGGSVGGWSIDNNGALYYEDKDCIIKLDATSDRQFQVIPVDEEGQAFYVDAGAHVFCMGLNSAGAITTGYVTIGDDYISINSVDLYSDALQSLLDLVSKDDNEETLIDKLQDEIDNINLDIINLWEAVNELK